MKSLTSIINLFITLLVISTIKTRDIKKGERCLLKALNKSDNDLKFVSDFNNLIQSVLDFPLLPEDLQKAYRECGINEELKEKCDKHFYPEECEECGMIYVKKCPKNYQRIDCGLCSLVCPPETTVDAAGALCKKPVMKKKQVYKYMLDCTKEHPEGCTDHQNFFTSNCPDNFVNSGNFLCTYKCPDQFLDKGIYCVPDIIENNQYFISDFVDSNDGSSAVEI
jgi:hypothetical protein